MKGIGARGESDEERGKERETDRKGKKKRQA